jgi:hypothetical protein
VIRRTDDRNVQEKIMHRAKIVAGFFIFVLVMLIAPESQALHQDWGGAEDDWSSPTSTSSSPTAITCKAYASKNQGCRSCKTQYDNDGEPTGQVVCAYVTQRGACSCSNVNRTCYEVGTCYYYYL